MAYTPKTWECGDTITADELNRMEEGISSAQGGGGTSSILKLVSNETTVDDIQNAVQDGALVYLLLRNPDTNLPSWHLLSSINGGQLVFTPNLSGAMVSWRNDEETGKTYFEINWK